MLLTWVNQSDGWNARTCQGAVIVSKVLANGNLLQLEVFKDGGVTFHSRTYISGRELRDMNAAIGEARAYLNQPVRDRGD